MWRSERERLADLIARSAYLAAPAGNADKGNEIDELERGLSLLTAALREIRNKQGKVCTQYTTCEHAACASSYAAWAIADAALGQSEPKSVKPIPAATIDYNEEHDFDPRIEFDDE